MLKLVIRVAVLVVILSLAIAPVAAEEPYVFPGEGKPYDGTTINVALVAESRSDAIKELLPEFEEQTGIKVNLDILPYPTLQEKQFTAVTQQSGAYDIVHVDCVWMGQYAGQGWLEPATDFIAQTDPEVLQIEDFHPRVLAEQSMWEDVVYGLPFINAVHVLYYLPEVLDKYDLEVPQTWDELYEAAKVISEGEGEDGVAGVTFMGKRGVQLLCNYVGMLGAFGGDFYDENYMATLADPEAIAALEYFAKLVEVANPGVLSQDYDECAQTFADGKAAMNLQWQNAAPWFDNPEKSSIVGKYGIAPQPGVEQEDGTILRSPCFGGWDMGISADSANKEAAWEFIVWATTPEMERELATAMPSSRVSVLGDEEFAADHIEYPVMVESFDYAMGRPRIPEWPQMADLIEAGLSEAMTGAKTPEEAMGDVNPLLDEILMGAGYQE